jgi:hypothetical protein
VRFSLSLFFTGAVPQRWVVIVWRNESDERKMKLSRAALMPARAACQFSPYGFFPDRNDHVQIKVTTQTGQSCAMAFKEGPGYHFTSASFLTPPPHGVLAKTGKTNFLYIPFKDYKGPDSYAIKICATVQGRKGCSSLTYVVDVQ